MTLTETVAERHKPSIRDQALFNSMKCFNHPNPDALLYEIYQYQDSLDIKEDPVLTYLKDLHHSLIEPPANDEDTTKAISTIRRKLRESKPVENLIISKANTYRAIDQKDHPLLVLKVRTTQEQVALLEDEAFQSILKGYRNDQGRLTIPLLILLEK